MMLIFSAAPALADTPAGIAHLGSADFTKGGTNIKVPVQGKCDVDGPTTKAAAPVSKTGITFGGGTSSCTTTVTDPNTDATTTSSKAEGKNFDLSALVSEKGPRVKIATYKVTCDATQTQTNAGWSYGGLSGIPALPNPVPEKHTVPLKKPDGTVLANAVFNIHDKPGDGSIALTMLRINFLPASKITGSVTVGHAACSPTP
ncbi:hypothetical protein SAMN05421504_106420 [Amycolatopsis xylanica]|uniref:Uncharacterized protein n=1 Tax=Amycolatopsis xylanica TaxID=589385 RepID=A0A1H3LZ33_9PSEU|nr:hypothetical protein [Amycolatopsis xylanica]SDY69583.1 hypothetical protein SAMN05421504_106420 [Amycolatopsis xylanica]